VVRMVGQINFVFYILKKTARSGRREHDGNYSNVSGPGPSPSRKDADS
jgi:hypothetical protein